MAKAKAAGRKKRVSSYDVAQHAGVSQATVSMVMTDRRDIVIPEETRRRVRRAADELGYLPSRLANGLLRGRTHTVGVVFLASPYSWNIFGGIQEALAGADYLPLVLTSHWHRPDAGAVPAVGPEPQSDELAWVHRLLEQHVDGLILYALEPGRVAMCLPDLERRRIPAVLIDHHVPHSGLDFSGSDEEALGRMAARHLLSLDRRDYAFLDVAHPYPSLDQRREHFAREIAGAGRRYAHLYFDGQHVPDVAEQLAERLEPPAALFAAHDLMATLAVQAAERLGWRVPEDLAVMGAGALDASLYHRPAITTLEQRPAEVGRRAARLLLERIAGHAGPAREERVAPILVPRASTAPAT